ncbi:MAG TPA: 3-keto-5-aminohexanoate cleavage protein, partial [Syntrophales bacterium]|nr:3-keto-5-aminohexanoate cleavage protein [Syntrophales bacterium]
EIYDVAMINNLVHMIEAGHIRTPVYLQFVMGLLGGIPATLDNLLFLYRTAKDALGDFVWSVCAAGQHQMKMGTAALLMGGNVRVGLEDSMYLDKGQLARSNAEQVAHIVGIARALGIEPATPAEAREILGLKGLDKVRY